MNKTISTTMKERGEALRANEYFDDLPQDILEKVCHYASLREYQRGATLFWEGDSCEGLHIMQQGSAKLFRISPQGRQYIVRILQEGETFGEVPAFDSGNNPVNAEALETCRVWIINGAELRNLAKIHPVFAQKALVNFGHMLRGMVHKVSEVAFYQVTHRLARLIEELPQDKHWTQEQMAARLGTVREVVARSLKELERSGAIVIEGHKIQIANREIFYQWAQPED